MKRVLIVMSVAAAFTIMPQKAEAQFLKKLGKAIETADKLLNGSGSSESKETGMQTTAATASPVTDGKPFRGLWYGQNVCLNIDFYDPCYPDPYSMDNPPCPGGMIVNGTEAAIDETKITGNKATVKMTWPNAEAENVTMTLEYQSNGDLVIRSAGYAYKDGNFEKSYVLPKEITLKKAVFAGEWTMKNKDNGTLQINLYEKCHDGQDAEYNDIMCYGTIYRMEGQRVEECSIVESKILSDTQAQIDFISGRDGNTYRATLVLDQAAKTATIKDKKKLKGDGFGDSYVYDGLVFYGK